MNTVPNASNECIVQDKISNENMSENNKSKLENKVLKKIILKKNQRFIKILAPPNSKNSESSSILIPSSTILQTQSTNLISAKMVEQHKNITNSHSSITNKSVNTSNPQIKKDIQISPVIISTNRNILKNQDKVVSSLLPVIIPNAINTYETKVQNTSCESTSKNLTHVTGVVSEKKIKIEYDTDSDNTSPAESSSNSSNTVLETKKFRSDQLKSPTYSNSKQFNTNKNPKFKKTSSLNITQIKHLEDKRFKKMNILLLKQLKLNNALREKIGLMSCTIRRLVKHHSKDYKRFLYDVFNEDQLRSLELKHTNPRSIVTWSDETMKKALKLKGECGNRGYEELLNQNIPLPSIRTISRWCNLRNLPIP